MAYARTYETFEVRKLLKEAEGQPSPITGAAAHSRTLHSVQTPGGEGVSKSDMVNRTHKTVGESNNAFKNRGGTTQTSAFTSLVQQAEAATQALNSTAGQAALAVLDLPANAGLRIRTVMSIADIREFGKAETSIGLLTSKKADVGPTPTKFTAMSGAVRGVRMIVDCIPGINTPNIFIQTCFPLDSVAGSTWVSTNFATNTVLASG